MIRIACKIRWIETGENGFPFSPPIPDMSLRQLTTVLCRLNGHSPSVFLDRSRYRQLLFPVPSPSELSTSAFTLIVYPVAS